MTITVQTKTTNKIAVAQGSQSAGAVVVKRGGDITVQSLSNVVSTDLQDGYTLIYDSQLNKWITQQVSNVAIQSVDGGTY